MPRKIKRFGPKNAAPGPDGTRPATNRRGTSGLPRKSLLSASSSRFIRGIPDQVAFGLTWLEALCLFLRIGIARTDRSR